VLFAHYPDRSSGKLKEKLQYTLDRLLLDVKENPDAARPLFYLGRQYSYMGNYEAAIERLQGLGIMINGSFVFGLDGDGPDVFERTVEWAVRRGLTTTTFHIATPYPGTGYYQRLEAGGRIRSRDWDDYNTRRVVFEPLGMRAEELQSGYERAYRDFYRWSSIFKAASAQTEPLRKLQHFAYAAAWKKFEPLWNSVIHLKKLNGMTPLLEAVLDRRIRKRTEALIPVEVPCPEEA
jgi:radical SAM superfamily enzyme YgiQ (UPF0313 family)